MYEFIQDDIEELAKNKIDEEKYLALVSRHYSSFKIYLYW